MVHASWLIQITSTSAALDVAVEQVNFCFVLFNDD